ncbi:MAG: homocysteine S-methyltransferase family protein [Oscillospiraceae bacterium]|nr:homocysteine S-methyltransferase family protein [Oscillospiraceae bacterium]
MQKISDLFGERILFFDGAMGTLLQQAGLGPGELPENWNITRPDVIRGIHKSYLDAGCDIVKTNTFGANALKLRGCDHTPAELVTAGVRLAREAIAEAGHGFAALDMGPTGKLLKPMGDLDHEAAYEAYKEMVIAGAEAGADCILIETMSDTMEIKMAVLAAKENADLPVFVTMVFDERARLLTGADIPAVTAMLEGLGVDAIGLNCGFGPDKMLPLAEQLTRCCSLPLIVNPNAGLPVVVDGKTVFNVSPDEFASSMVCIAEKGIWFAGGCCGTTPAHIAAEVKACRDMPVLPLPDNRRTVVSSGSMAVEIGGDPVVIGERINPTGKSRFKKALRDHDIDYILNEGIVQQENGAHILDVNVGLPEIDEPAMMKEAVSALQSVVNLPLQIDTTSTAAMEAALRIYNGKPMINSVSGKKESMDAIFPLAKKYGGVIVALTLDEEGIPSTAEGRLAVAEKIVRTAESYGIGREDIIVDALTMTVSSDPGAAAVTLDALKLIREKLGVRTVLGVSNVSFGLPKREIINSAFYLLALQAGLDAAILNPGSAPMMQSLRSYRALSGKDDRFADYIAGCSGEESAPVPRTSAEVSLSDAVLRGLKEEAALRASEALKTEAPLDVISGQLIPALDKVGKGFEKGTVFLPQLLMSADAAKAAFAVIRDALAKSGGDQQKKGKIILATVKGDIHDIGKNIVKVLLENYGYDVIDLGKDVPPEKIVETVAAQKVKLAGLSALMTTTVPAMEETIRQLRAAGAECKVMVGGAVLTQEYADMIGADFYAKDAMGAVHIAEKVLGE